MLTPKYHFVGHPYFIQPRRCISTFMPLPCLKYFKVAIIYGIYYNNKLAFVRSAKGGRQC
uniref:Uncharacterized protein n=1 Tax=Rhizophora mucronata TaxID=61149 RepID=A0A2P2QJZ6_RHIMU